MPTTAEKIFALLQKKHPDCLLTLSLHYSPGVPAKTTPHYHCSAHVNGVLTYSANTDHYANPIVAMFDMLEMLGGK
jgi:hypothetical protein